MSLFEHQWNGLYRNDPVQWREDGQVVDGFFRSYYAMPLKNGKQVHVLSADGQFLFIDEKDLIFGNN